jgi:MFS family permease
VGKALGWRPVFYLAALPGFLLAAIVWFLPEPPKGQSDFAALGTESQPSASEIVPFAAALRELLAVPTLLVTYAVTVLINLATAGVIYWLPTFAVRLHSLGEDQAGLIIGALTVVTGGAGVLSGGFVADRMLRRTPSGRLLTISASYALGFPLALAAVWVHDTTLFLLMATGAVYLFTFYFPCLAPLVHQVTRPGLRATAMGLYLLAAHLLGNAVAPPLIGWLSDRSGDLRLGLAIALSLAFLGALIGFWGTRFVGRDTEAMLERLRVGRQG